MRPTDVVVTAWTTMTAHKLRSFLALLGLVMGVATLITVMTLVQGANSYVEQKIANLGTRVFQVQKTPVIPTDFNEFLKALRNKNIMAEDMFAVRERCQHCEAVGGQYATPSAHIYYKNKELQDAGVFGQTWNMGYIGSRTLDIGRYFTQFEETAGTDVAVIGYGVNEKFFGGVNAIDQLVRFGGEEFRVIGVVEKIGSVLGQDQDNFILIPWTAYRRLQGSKSSMQLSIRASDDANFQTAQDETRQIMRGRRHIGPNDKEDFYFGTPDSYMSLWRSISGAFFAVFVLISSISSVVGGIVIMNIMLVSVTERTKEIGLRRAVGAREIDIMRQFLAEAMLQCMIGGGIGVGLGFGAATLLKVLTSFPADVKTWVAVMGLVLASVIGLFFGIYPAMKAAKLDPVVALRSE
jgi:putative ABC transport system permease protein